MSTSPAGRNPTPKLLVAWFCPWAQRAWFVANLCNNNSSSTITNSSSSTSTASSSSSSSSSSNVITIVSDDDSIVLETDNDGR
jgi:hypothetical protein